VLDVLSDDGVGDGYKIIVVKQWFGNHWRYWTMTEGEWFGNTSWAVGELPQLPQCSL
jgi:hypothetical protein